MSEKREHPGNLPLLPMGWAAANLKFNTAEDFWAEAQRVTATASLGDNLDIAMAGESSPRIWLFLHEPGQGQLSAAAALAMARALGGRDQAVLILDCDDADSKLTRWAGRHESEGWIDLVRYGASVLTSGVALPFEGRRGYILGVGSFTPTDVEPQEAEDLINRLKRQADDLVLVAPANVAGKLWARLADIRLLCWDRVSKPAELIERICAGFEAADTPLTSLIGFGLPEEGVALGGGQAQGSAEVTVPVVDDQDLDEDDLNDDLDERLEAADLEDVDYTESYGQDEDLETEELGDEDDDGFGPSDDSEPGDDQDEGLDEEPEEELEAPGVFVPAPDLDTDHEPGTGSSRVFWGAAIVSLAIILVVSVYYLKFVRVDEPVAGRRQPVVAEQAQPKRPAPIQTQETTAMDTPDVAADDQTDGQTDEMGEMDSEGGESAIDTEPADQPTVVETPPETVIEEPAQAPAEVEAQETPARQFTMDPYMQPVGSDGWALHLYSFPDSVTAETEVRRLQRKGFQTATRAVEVKDKGVWYRVYVGSFLSRKEALQDKDLLLKELKTDWARATEF